MKNISIYIQKLILLFVTVAIISCNKNLDSLSPHNVNFEDQQFLTNTGFTKATIGNYTFLSGSSSTTAYEFYWFNLSEFRGNNVKFIDITSTNTSSAAQDVDAFNFTNSTSKDFGLSNSFWFASYQALLGINTVLKHVSPTETDPVILQAQAENLFLRAVINFNLVRVYGLPYYQSPETNLGVPLIITPITSTNDAPARATVKANYAQIVDDLNNAAKLFTQKKVNSFATKYAAYALLSRVYLYMSGTLAQPNVNYAQLSSQYVDSVILNGGYSLLQGSAYSSYYNNSNQANTETIWAINNDAVSSFIPRLLMQPAGTYAGSPQYSTGQAKPSPDFLNQLTTGDLRKGFYLKDKYPNNNIDTFSCMKYGYKYINTGVYYSNAPVHYLRLAEMYLNRAEARLKQGNNAGALTDVNVIRVRAGLAAVTGLSGQALFNEILLQRRIELAFEGHNSFDYFRVGLPMVRNYSSFNSNAITINANDPKVVMRISQDVLAENGKMKQNDQ